MSSAPFSQSERVERLRAQLQGRPVDARSAERPVSAPATGLFHGVMLRGLARLDAGLELTDLEAMLVNPLRELLTEEETREFGRVFLEEGSVRNAPALFPATLTTRDLAEGYAIADLVKDLPELAPEILAQPNLSVVDVDAVDVGGSFDSVEFTRAAADFGYSATAVTSSAYREEAARALGQVDARVDFYKFQCIRRSTELGHDEPYWAYASATDGRRKYSHTTPQFDKIAAGYWGVFDANTTLFSGPVTNGAAFNITCFERDRSGQNWHVDLARQLQKLSNDILALVDIIDALPGSWGNITNFLTIGAIAAKAVSDLMILFNNPDDLVAQRTLSFDRAALMSLAGRPEANYWDFDGGKQGWHQLYLSWNAPGAKKLLWTSTKDGTTWSAPAELGTHSSAASPALARTGSNNFTSSLVAVHRGFNTEDLWYTTLKPTTSQWSANLKLGAHFSVAAPALAEYNGVLHCVHRGYTKDTALWMTTLNGTRWSTDVRIPGNASEAGPALAVYDNELYCVYRGGGNDQYLWVTRYNGTRWSTAVKISSTSTRSATGPAVAVYRGELYVVHRGSAPDNTSLYWTRYNGTWSTDTKLGTHTSLENPALAVFNDKLYVVHRAGNSAQLWTSYFNPANSTWSPNIKIDNQYTATGPALTIAGDTMYCLYRRGGI